MMLMRRSLLWVFLASSLVFGLAYWWQTDWWAYVGVGPDRMPKFTMPWWWQFGESGLVGAAAGGLLAGAVYLLHAGLCRLTRPDLDSTTGKS